MRGGPAAVPQPASDPLNARPLTSLSRRAQHPAWPVPVNVEVHQRPAGDDDERITAQTIDHMRRLVIEDSDRPDIRAIARTLHAVSADETVARVFAFVRKYVRFRADEETAAAVVPARWLDDIEVLIRPADLVTMRRPAGDCASQSMLAAALLRALGIRTYFKTIAARPADPDTYSHVYVLADTPTGAVPIDASHGPAPRWEYPTRGKTRIWPVEEDLSIRPLTAAGLAGLGLTIDWGKVASDSIDNAWDIAEKVIVPRFKNPSVDPGTSIVRVERKDGSTEERISSFPGGGFSGEDGIGLGTVAIAVIGLAAAALIFRGKR